MDVFSMWLALKTRCRRGGVVIAKVLVIDAEDAICTLFAAMLRQYGCYQVVTTTDGRYALDLLRSDSFDVVLLDMHMPGITAQDLIQQITQTFEELPVILVTGYGSMETAEELP